MIYLLFLQCFSACQSSWWLLWTINFSLLVTKKLQWISVHSLELIHTGDGLWLRGCAFRTAYRRLPRRKCFPNWYQLSPVLINSLTEIKNLLLLISTRKKSAFELFFLRSLRFYFLLRLMFSVVHCFFMYLYCNKYRIFTFLFLHLCNEIVRICACVYIQSFLLRTEGNNCM